MQGHAGDDLEHVFSRRWGVACLGTGIEEEEEKNLMTRTENGENARADGWTEFSLPFLSLEQKKKQKPISTQTTAATGSRYEGRYGRQRTL